MLGRYRFSNTLPKNSFSHRLLKEAQVQGAATLPLDGYPADGYPPQVGHRRWAFFSSLLARILHEGHVNNPGLPDQERFPFVAGDT